MKYFLLFDIKIIMRNYKKIAKDFKIPLQYPTTTLAYKSLFYNIFSYAITSKMLNNNTNISKVMTRHVKIVNSDTNTSKLVMRHV